MILNFNKIKFKELEDFLIIKRSIKKHSNGIKYGTVVPGRIIANKSSNHGFFAMTDRSITLQSNYAKNAPGKHHRQFTVPFKINEAELGEDGSIDFC